MTFWKLRLPKPPSLNQIHRSAYMGYKNGRHVSRIVYTKEARAYLAEIQKHWLIGRPYFQPLENPVQVCAVFHPADRRRQDIMNREKLLCDGLTSAGAWLDDSQVKDFRIVEGEIIRPSGGLVICWREMNPGDGAAQFAVQGGLFDDPLP